MDHFPEENLRPGPLMGSTAPAPPPGGRPAVRLLPILALLLVLLAGLYFVRYVPSESGDALLEPRIHALPDQRMLVYSGRGDPNHVAGTAFATLYRAYYRGVEGAWRRRPEAPRARWDLSMESKPREEWQGRYALPLPTDADMPAAEGLSVETWEYGEVAEILHVGPYSAEASAIARLREFIRQSGYRVAGDHEEVYLKGPGMLLKGNPARYRTFIRYRVQALSR